MLSLTTTFIAFPSQAPHTLQQRHIPSAVVIRSSSDNGNNIASSSSGNDNNIVSGNDFDSPPPVPPPDTVGIRFRRGSRKRRKQELDVADKMPSKQAAAPKDWDSMTLSEKLVELYMGEKGLLFWLNKFAYASIFIVIGGWIVFRFVGPALNLYQLDTPPLSPTSIFK